MAADDLTLSQFRGAYSVFADEQEYPDFLMAPYIAAANTAMNADRWGEFLSLGRMLWIAHFLSMGKRAASGAFPGAPGGVVSSKSVGSVSVGYDTSQGAESAAAGQFNLTIYGRQWWNLAMMVGMGGLQSGGLDILLGPSFGQAWPGVVH